MIGPDKNHKAFRNVPAAGKRSLSGCRPGLLFLFFFLIPPFLALSFRFLRYPIVGDTSHYFYMSERVASGVSPYLSNFENRHGLSMMISGAVIAAGRGAGLRDFTSVRILFLAVTTVSSGLIWLYAYRLTGRLRASLFAGAVMLSFTPWLFLGMTSCRPKIFMVLFTLLTLIAFQRRKPFWTGVAAAAAYLCWHPAILLLIAVIPAAFLRPARGRFIGAAFLGALTAGALYESYFALTGSLKEQLEQTFYFPARYMVPQRFAQGKWNLANLLGLAVTWMKWFRDCFVPPMFLYGLIRLAVQFRKDFRQSSRKKQGLSGWPYFAICTAGALAVVFFEHGAAPDLLIILHFAAVLAGWTLDRTLRDLEGLLRGRGARAAAAAVTLGLGLLVFRSGFRLHKNMNRPRITLADQYRLGEEVGRFIREGRSVYAIECAHLLAFNHAQNWLKYANFFRNYEKYFARKTGREKFLPVLDGKWPEIILYFPRYPVRSFVEWKPLYREVTPAAFRRQKIQVWELR